MRLLAIGWRVRSLFPNSHGKPRVDDSGCLENAGAIAADEKVRMPGRIDIQIMASRKCWFSATLEKEWKCRHVRGPWQSPVRRYFPRALHPRHGGIMFNRPPAHGNPDNPATIAAAFTLPPSYHPSMPAAQKEAKIRYSAVPPRSLASRLASNFRDRSA